MTDEELKAIEERLKIKRFLGISSYRKDIAALLAEVKRWKDSPYCSQCGEPRQDGMCHCTVVAAFKGDSND